MENTILSLIKVNANIPRNLIKVIEIKKDGTCSYRTLSLFFTGDENEYKIQAINLWSSKNNKTLFTAFFLPPEEGLDDIIVNRKYDNYIEEIKQDGFYAGNIELAITYILFNLNISVYRLLNDQDTIYTHYTNIWKDINDKKYKFILILFSGNNHYLLMTLKRWN